MSKGYGPAAGFIFKQTLAGIETTSPPSPPIAHHVSSIHSLTCATVIVRIEHLDFQELGAPFWLHVRIVRVRVGERIILQIDLKSVSDACKR